MTSTESPEDRQPKDAIIAAGCVAARTDDRGEIEFLIIRRSRYNDWSLPKGKVDSGESFLKAALRELTEETGISANDPRLIGSIGYATRNGRPKMVRWWLVTPTGGEFVPNQEVDETRWVSHTEALKTLSYRNDREVLDRAHEMLLETNAGTIYLVRHASAGVRDEANSGDALRKLDKSGRRQRRDIRDQLSAHPISVISSSEFPRCVKTVKPLSNLLGVRINRESALAEGAHTQEILDLISRLQGESAVLCSHGDVIGDLVGHLFAEGVAMEGPMQSEKGSIWELGTVKGRIVSGRYNRPRS